MFLMLWVSLTKDTKEMLICDSLLLACQEKLIGMVCWSCHGGRAKENQLTVRDLKVSFYEQKYDIWWRLKKKKVHIYQQS